MRWPVLLVALLASPAAAALSPAELAQVGSTPPAGAVLPAGLAFVDQNGARYILADGPLPTVLLFADFSCRHVCGPGITLTAGALHDAGLRAGRDYRMVVIGMDGDGPILARTLIVDRLAALPEEARRVVLLSGTPATIARAEVALGYHAVYDSQADQFAHDASLYVFAPGGALADVLPETETTPAQVAAAVAHARAGAPYVAPPPRAATGVIGRISAICYGLAAAHGVYARPIVALLRGGGIVICLLLAGFIAWSLRRQRRAAA